MKTHEFSIGGRVALSAGLGFEEGTVVDVYEGVGGLHVSVRITHDDFGEVWTRTDSLPAKMFIPLGDRTELSHRATWMRDGRVGFELASALLELAAEGRVVHALRADVPTGPDTYLDYVVEADHGQVIVQARLDDGSPALDAPTVRDVARDAERAGLPAVIAVNGDVTADADDLLARTPTLRILRWTGPDDVDALVAALTTPFGATA